MNVNELDDYMRDWFRKLTEKERPLPTYSPAQVERSTVQFTGDDAKDIIRTLRTLGTTNSNTNENNRNV